MTADSPAELNENFGPCKRARVAASAPCGRSMPSPLSSARPSRDSTPRS